MIHNNLGHIDIIEYHDILMYQNVYLYIATTDAVVVHYDCKFYSSATI